MLKADGQKTRESMVGYYIFVGRGDFGSSLRQTFDPTFGGNVPCELLGDWGLHRTGASLEDAPEWSSAWDRETWIRHIDFLVDELGANTLNLLMNGFELPYPSKRFPEAVEMGHKNVENEFFQEVLDHAYARGLRIMATFTTTGHAESFAAAHPEATTLAEDGSRHVTNLCHHQPLGREYAFGVAEEVLTRYHGFEDICFHPPENAMPCQCECCRLAFVEATGKAWKLATEKEIADFYWDSCLGFQNELETFAQSLLPGVRFFAITIPELFERHWDTLATKIPHRTTVCHWDYWSVDERLSELEESLRIFQRHGHNVVYIPSSGWSLDKWGDTYGEKVLSQIEAARRVGVTDILYFVGAIWHEPSLCATSLTLHRSETLALE